MPVQKFAGRGSELTDGYTYIHVPVPTCCMNRSVTGSGCIDGLYKGCGLVSKYSLLEGNRWLLLAVQLCVKCGQTHIRSSFYQGERLVDCCLSIA